MIFSVGDHVQLIRDGKKTMTRRLLTPFKHGYRVAGDLRCLDDAVSSDVEEIVTGDGTTRIFRNPRLFVRKGGVYAIQAKRGGIAVGHIQVISIAIEARPHDPHTLALLPYPLLSAEDALAEGGYTPLDYQTLWESLYGGKDCFRAVYTFRFIERAKKAG